jgi:hypothetical protein
MVSTKPRASACDVVLGGAYRGGVNARGTASRRGDADVWPVKTLPPDESLAESSGAPYQIGKRIRVTGTSGQHYLVRIEHMTEHPASESCSLVAAILRPRRFRGSVILMDFPCQDAVATSRPRRLRWYA